MEGKLPGILELEDNVNALIFEKGQILKECLDGYVWANNVWLSQNLYPLEEHTGHESISKVLYSEFNLTKRFDSGTQAAHL